MLKTRTDLINAYIKKYGYTNYLEIGVDNGINFNAVECENKYSVDPADGDYSHAEPTYQMTSDEFFENVAPDFEKPFDIVFIDGLHEAEQVDKDIYNALNYLSENGTIILHDCNPQSECAQIVPRQQKVWNGDVWRSVVRFRLHQSKNEQYLEYGVCVLNIDEGLGIISRNMKYVNLPHSYYKQSTRKFEMSYDILDKYRETLLNLIEADDFEV